MASAVRLMKARFMTLERFSSHEQNHNPLQSRCKRGHYFVFKIGMFIVSRCFLAQKLKSYRFLKTIPSSYLSVSVSVECRMLNPTLRGLCWISSEFPCWRGITLSDFNPNYWCVKVIQVHHMRVIRSGTPHTLQTTHRTSHSLQAISCSVRWKRLPLLFVVMHKTTIIHLYIQRCNVRAYMTQQELPVISNTHSRWDLSRQIESFYDCRPYPVATPSRHKNRDKILGKTLQDILCCPPPLEWLLAWVTAGFVIFAKD